MKTDYKETFDNFIELTDRFTIISGHIDIAKYIDGKFRCRYGEHFTDINPLSELFTCDNFWIIAGKGCNESILDDIREYEYDVEKEGEYLFKAMLTYYNSETDDYGRTIMRGYYDIVHLELEFIQTFESRNREKRIDTILGDDIFNF